MSRRYHRDRNPFVVVESKANFVGTIAEPRASTGRHRWRGAARLGPARSATSEGGITGEEGDAEGGYPMSIKTKVFISYNRQDEKYATKLALELQQSPEVDVFIDHWNMSAGDPLLDRIESAIDDSSFLLVLLSSSSVESQWVRTELRYAYLKEQEANRNFIIPVLLDSCKLPIHVAGRIYVDYRPDADKERALQYIFNAIRGGKTFSQAVSDFMHNVTYHSPYTDKAVREGRRILIDLAQHREMDVEENQKWLLWELFHHLLGRYQCTMKVGKNRYVNLPPNTFLFTFIDRWNEKSCNAILSPQEFDQGLWGGEFDLLSGGSLTAANLTLLGSTGRLSFQSKFNPHADQNPFLDSCSPKMRPIHHTLEDTMRSFDEGSQQSFLFDLQHIVFSRFDRKVKVVVGAGSEDLCRAFSSFHLVEHSQPSSQWAIFEVYDPFFCTRKYTAVCPAHLEHEFEGDVDLMGSSEEVLLGPA